MATMGGPLPGEQTEGLHVEHNPFRSAFFPVLGGGDSRDGVVTGIYLQQVGCEA